MQERKRLEESVSNHDRIQALTDDIDTLFELAPAGITANAILAGVTETPALELIPGNEKIVEIARQRNPHGRLTTPEEVARCIGGFTTSASCLRPASAQRGV